MANGHILLLVFPFYGSINPATQFAERLLMMGLKVTIVTPLSVRNRLPKTFTALPGLTIEYFSDGFDNGFQDLKNPLLIFSQFQTQGSKAMSELIKTCSKEGKPITRLVYLMNLTWASKLAKEFNIPSTVLWVQPTMVFDIYYYYFNGYADAIGKCNLTNPETPIELPSLPLLKTCDLPSFLQPSNVHSFALPQFKEQMELLNEEPDTQILINTFDALEPEALKSLHDKFKLVAIGPLVPSKLLTEELQLASNEKNFSQESGNYIDWLNSKPKSSVVYASFGSVVVIAKQQIEEMALGLLKCGRPFLWVVREAADWEKEGVETISCMKEVKKQGMIVPWCCQADVLSHPSLGCFFSHCGWNSTLEGIASGIPMVGFPQFTDQPTNAKLVEDLFRTGIRVQTDAKGMVTGDEIVKCIETVMGDGERGEEMRSNAKKWKATAMEAMKEGGSSHENLRAFVNENTDSIK